MCAAAGVEPKRTEPLDGVNLWEALAADQPQKRPPVLMGTRASHTVFDDSFKLVLFKAGKPGLPDGIEVQILDHGYTERMKARGAKTDWFGTNGDVFPVRVKMTPFPPLSPDGSRSFP